MMLRKGLMVLVSTLFILNLPFEHPQLRRARAAVLSTFLIRGNDDFFVDCATRDGGRAKDIFYDAIFERMKRQNGQPPPRRERRHERRKSFLKDPQLIVHREPERHEVLGGRVLPLLPPAIDALDEARQLARGFIGFDLSIMDDGSDHPKWTLHFAPLAEQPIELVLGERIHDVFGCDFPGAIHSHVERPIVVKTESALRLIQLRRTDSEIQQHHIKKPAITRRKLRKVRPHDLEFTGLDQRPEVRERGRDRLVVVVHNKRTNLRATGPNSAKVTASAESSIEITKPWPREERLEVLENLANHHRAVTLVELDLRQGFIDVHDLSRDDSCDRPRINLPWKREFNQTNQRNQRRIFMLINCPRCGFSQPKDRYCAQCGIDMDAYKPPQAPLLRRTLGHPALQLGFVIFLGGAVGLSLWQRNRDDLDDRVRYLKSGVQVSTSTEATTDPEDAPASDPKSLDAETTSEPNAAALTEEASDLASAGGEVEKARTAGSPAETANGAPPANGAVAPASTTSLATGGDRIIFRLTAVEASSRYLQQVLFPDSRQTGQINNIGDYVAGLIPDLPRRLAGNNPDLKVLLKEERPIEVGRALQFFQGLRAGDALNEIGFTYHILLTQADSDNYRAQIEIVRSAKIGGGPGSPPALQKTPFPADFDLNEGAAFFMSGLMMRGGPAENDNELAAVRPFQILRSSAFRTQASEYIVFIEFDRP